MQRLVTTTYLEMTRRQDLCPAPRSAIPFQLVRVEIPCPELNRCLYTAVGARWWWYSRLSWDYARWLANLDRPDLETWIAYVSGTPAGYFELERQHDDAVELAYFGLLPRFIGRGIGGHLLTSAIARTWDMGAQRVWVHIRRLGRLATSHPGREPRLIPPRPLIPSVDMTSEEPPCRWQHQNFRLTCLSVC
jgi:GNAT superfamily N-acetyltransferase